MVYLLSATVLLSILNQGGYFHTPFLLAAVALAVSGVAVFKRRISSAELVLWLLSGVYLLASLINGYSSSSLAQACLPGTAAAVLYCYLGLSEKNREKLLNILLLSTAALAGLGILAICDVISVSGAVTSHRLQFPFQYANAAGSWYAAMVLLAQDREKHELRGATLPLQTALFLTRSIGALGLYALAEITYVYCVRKQSGKWQGILLSNGLSAAFAIIFFFLHNAWALIPFALLYVAVYYAEPIIQTGKKFRLHWLILVSGLVAAWPVISSERVSQGTETFRERLFQISDGLKIIAAHPLLGIGAENWGYEYPYYQTETYVTSVVHSSLIQIGVDAGVLAMILAVLVFVLAIKSGKRPLTVTLAGVILIGHSLLDFNLQFFPVDALAMFTLFYGHKQENTVISKLLRTIRVVGLCFAGLCTFLLFCEIQYKQMVYSNQAGMPEQALARYERYGTLFGENANAKKAAALAAAAQKNYPLVLELTENEKQLDARTAALRAEALYSVEGKEAAVAFLNDISEKRAYQKHFAEQIEPTLQKTESMDE